MKRFGVFLLTCLIGLMVVISSCEKVEFKEQPKTFSFSASTLTLRKGEIRPLAYPIFSTNYRPAEIRFEVENTNVVYIDQQMQLQALNIGETDLKAYLNSEQIGILRIIVREP